MNLKFIAVELFNFMSFESAFVDLSDNGFVKVCGENNNLTDNATSNGSGKSAVWEAINWCLTGLTIRGSKDVVRHDCDEGCYVNIIFKVDTDTYEILRAKNHNKYKTNLFIRKNGEDVSGKGIRDTEKLLQQYLPDLDSNLINSIVILGQGLPMRFTNNTPSGRKDLLEVLSKSDFMIADLKLRVADRKNYLFAQKTILEKEESKYETLMLLAQNRIEFLRQSLADLQNEDVQYLYSEKETLEKELASLEDKLADLSHKYGHSLKEEDDELQNKRVKLYDELNRGLQEFNDRKTALISSFNEETIGLTADLKHKKEEAFRLESVTDVCPTCGQKLKGVHKVDTTSLHQEIDILEKELREKTSEMEVERDKISNDLQQFKEDLQNQIAISTSKINEVNAEMRQHSNLAVEMEMKLNKIKELDSKIGSHENDIKACKSDLDAENAREQEAHNIYWEKKNALEDLGKHLDVQNSFETALKRDFRGILLQNCITYINSKAKEYCKKIFDTDSIEFALDGNNISICYSGKEYESLSGGEKQKIDLIIQFSIRDMLCTYLDFNCNLLVLDELTDNLDSIGCKKVIDFISTELTDIDSVFIISHRTDLEVPYDKTLNVIKNEQGISSCVLS